MSPGRTFIQWCRRGESNRRATLKTRKLQILLNARNAKTARNVFRGYAAATRSRCRGSSWWSESWVRKNSFRIRRPTNSATGPPFFQKNPAGQDLRKTNFLARMQNSFSKYLLDFSRSYVGRDIFKGIIGPGPPKLARIVGLRRVESA